MVRVTLLCYLRVTISIAIAIAIVGLLWCSGYTWREGRHGDEDVDRGRADVDEGALLADSRSHDGPCSDAVVCVSRL